MNFVTEISLVLYSISLTWTLYQRINTYPALGRFEDFSKFVKWKITGKISTPTKLSKKIGKKKYEKYLKNSFLVISISYFLIFLWLATAGIALYGFDIILGDKYSLIVLVLTPFLYLIFPRFISILLTSVVFLATPDDYFWYKDNQPTIVKNAFLEPFRSELEQNLKQKNVGWFLYRGARNIIFATLCLIIPLVVAQI